VRVRIGESSRDIRAEVDIVLTTSALSRLGNAQPLDMADGSTAGVLVV